MHALCPYFAMFPARFVRAQVEAYTKCGDIIFDPFSGRGTTVFESLLLDRWSAATDTNPVAYCISGAKAETPHLNRVLAEFDVLEDLYADTDFEDLESERLDLPAFFRRAYYHSTLRELLFLRRALNWRSEPIHRFIAALVLGSLHGEMGKPMVYFSNQMPRTISTKPDYSLKYWKERNLWPNKREVFDVLRERAKFRLSLDLPTKKGEVALRDAREAAAAFPHLVGRVRLIVTSPPYLNVTDYAEDQWLRLWFLGFAPYPTYGRISKDDRLRDKEAYWRFLTEAWKGIALLMRADGILVCRMGAAEVDSAELTNRLYESLKSVFPDACFLSGPLVSKMPRKQTESFRPGSKGFSFEVDYVFRLH